MCYYPPEVFNLAEIKLVVNGKEIPTNEFVKDFLANTVAGAVSSLHGVEEDWKELEMRISR